jgi:hypothetical protein
MNRNPECECYFYKFRTDGEPGISGNTLFLKGQETQNNIHAKTLAALEFLKDRLDEFDFIFRPNLSSFILLDRYLEYMKTLPTKMCVEGPNLNYGGMIYPSGCGYSFTPDVARIILKRQDRQYHMDDMTIGKICKEEGIRIIHRNFTMITDTNVENAIGQIRNSPTIFHMRVKQPPNNRRWADVANYTRLVDAFYPDVGPEQSQ